MCIRDSVVTSHHITHKAFVCSKMCIRDRGYTLPKAITSVAGIINLRGYCSLDDFFTITKYPGADPETASINSGASRGFDNGTYPTSRCV